ncbi:MAG: hypothetical protein GXO10_05310 [Crenarchaeota archaeon]|nr:hypothetical protein [Thermoproteota archaeon]
MPRKKKDLTELLMELKKSKQREDNQHTAQTTDNKHAVLREVRITIDIPQLEELIREVRQLRESITEFVRIIKTRLEESEEEQEERPEQPIAQIEEKTEQ